MSIIKNEMNKTKKTAKYKLISDDIRKTKKFLSQNELVAVPSDKTNRIVVTEKSAFDESTKRILQDIDTYELLPRSKSKSLEKQANKIVRSVCQGTKFESDIPKLLTNGSNPAKFKTFIKDHKSKVE